jgi:RimJ/RimL family protein N-acetyltransferase
MAEVAPATGRPGRAPLTGGRVRLEPVSRERHGADLFAAAQGDPALWNYLPYGPFAGEAEMGEHLDRQAASEDPLFLAVIVDGRAVGVMSYMRMEPQHGCIEIGHIWFGAPLQRTAAATEAIYLLAREAFDGLGNRRFEWKCNAANDRSRRAAERFGFTFEGVFRQHMIVKGRNRDTAWYALLDDEWPAAAEAFEAWLAPANFDADGRQRESLQALRQRSTATAPAGPDAQQVKGTQSTAS